MISCWSMRTPGRGAAAPACTPVVSLPDAMSELASLGASHADDRRARCDGEACAAGSVLGASKAYDRSELGCGCGVPLTDREGGVGNISGAGSGNAALSGGGCDWPGLTGTPCGVGRLRPGGWVRCGIATIVRWFAV